MSIALASEQKAISASVDQKMALWDYGVWEFNSRLWQEGTSYGCRGAAAVFSQMWLFSDYRIKGSMTDMIEPGKNEVQKSKWLYFNNLY